MTWTPISGTAPQYDSEGNDYWLKFYQSGTTTPFSAAVDSAGSNPQAKIKLNLEGFPISNPLDETTIFIPHVDQDYRIVLYKSEADADANNTANAAFNIDGVPQNISPILENAVAIDMRNTTLLIQDDYDRSPKFIDGVDFTAGAGPHVITVPAGWTPSNADTRFYKLDDSGIITPLTPTSKDATTFTIPITLLSTDILFIGDDKFRDQNDGDPVYVAQQIGLDDLSGVTDAATARTNINVYSKTEVDSGFLDDVPNSVSGTNIQDNAIIESKLKLEVVEIFANTGTLAPGATAVVEFATTESSSGRFLLGYSVRPDLIGGVFDQQDGSFCEARSNSEGNWSARAIIENKGLVSGSGDPSVIFVFLAEV